MPHDRDGRLLSVGDLVNVPCRVKAIHDTEQFCNVDLETRQPMYPDTYLCMLTLNAKQVVKADPPPEPPAASGENERGVWCDACRAYYGPGFPAHFVNDGKVHRMAALPAPETPQPGITDPEAPQGWQYPHLHRCSDCTNEHWDRMPKADEPHAGDCICADCGYGL